MKSHNYNCFLPGLENQKFTFTDAEFDILQQYYTKLIVFDWNYEQIDNHQEWKQKHNMAIRLRGESNMESDNLDLNQAFKLLYEYVKNRRLEWKSVGVLNADHFVKEVV